jgi:hypothetical protein
MLGCSNNSAFLGPTSFYELSEVSARREPRGFHLRGMIKNNVSWNVDVTGTVLIGYRWTIVGGLLLYQQLAGSNLVNAELIVDNDDGRSYRIRIMSATTQQQFWQAPLTTVNTYELKWRQMAPVTSDYVPVCKNPPNRELEDGALQTLTESILFTGDRYDTDTLTITATNRPRPAGGSTSVAPARCWRSSRSTGTRTPPPRPTSRRPAYSGRRCSRCTRPTSAARATR